MSATGTRIENRCRKALSQDGTYSPKLNPTVSERLIRFCIMADTNKVKFVENAVSAALDQAEKELLESKTKEELIELLLRR